MDLPFSPETLQSLCNLVNSAATLKPSRPARVISGGFSAEYPVPAPRDTNVSLEVSTVFENRVPVIRVQVHCSASYVSLDTAAEFHRVYGEVITLANLCLKVLAPE
jgi:hypothetical protein